MLCFNSKDGAIDSLFADGLNIILHGFNSKDGAIDRLDECWEDSSKDKVSIPKMVRLIAPMKKQGAFVAYEFQFQRWCD